ncbi:MAG: Rpn family recombination-promoting nuclease/putative transposase [bacterium]|nr:Rpn family recombination-promoting nuclease/putative transposase [bacterium]MCM1376651.1 Rpn family recombination-promoting nuclease/putative transposase [Muribaculum sp.]
MSRRKTQEGFLAPKSDVAFKELMRIEEVRRCFIGNVLDIPLEEIKSVRLENTFLSRRSRVEKECVLDVRMLLNDNRKINVEMQIRRVAYWDKRSLFYLAKMYTDTMFKGYKYDRLKKCIVIDILDFDWDDFPEYHKKYGLRDREGRLYSDQFEIHIIELNKELTGDRLDDWVRLFRIESREELEKMQSENAGVKRALEEVRAMNLFRMAKLRYEEYLKNQRDLWAMEVAAKEDGWKAGHAEGLAAGHAAGLAAGRTAGLEYGVPIGKLDQSRQVIYDFLSNLGEIPEDIRLRVDAEEDMQTLKNWYMAAPKVKSANEFRKLIED